MDDIRNVRIVNPTVSPSLAEPMVTVPATTLVVVTGNHGGYLSTKCLICGECGWQNRWKHKPECVVGQALINTEIPC